MKYRPEIDGFRAIAVVPVVLFHAGLDGFEGGFVGVDVFFVISGFLITGLLLEEIGRGGLSILSFYERRARRILPALFAVMAACVPFAAMWMLPGDIAGFARSVLASSLFYSNVLFWSESGYFDTAAELKPLLHTWSLSVEEQFYILFPLILVLVVRWRRAWLVPVLWAAAAASFGLALFLAPRAPEANFFLSGTRFWELLAGALCAERVARRGRRPNVWAAAAGLAMVAAAIGLFHGDLPFPSHYALLPVAGTCLVLLFAEPGAGVGRLLARRGPVAVGLISYSLYLWHQPVLVFARLRAPGLLEGSGLALLFALMAVLAVLSWRFVERPFRRSPMPRRAVFAVSLAGLAAFSAVGAAVGYGDGWRAPYLAALSVERRDMVLAIEAAQAETRNLADTDRGSPCVFSAQLLDEATRDRIRACRESHGPGVLVLGDSHGVDILSALASVAPADAFVAGLVKPSCRPHTEEGMSPRCPYAAALELVATGDDFRAVVFSQAGFYLLRNDRGRRAQRPDFQRASEAQFAAFAPNEEVIGRVAAYLETLARHLPVLWLGPRVEPHIQPAHFAWRGCRFPYALRPGQRAVFTRLDAAVKARLERSPVRFMSQQEAVNLTLPGDLVDCENLYFADGDHYSAAGQRRFGARMDLWRHVERLVQDAGG